MEILRGSKKPEIARVLLKKKKKRLKNTQMHQFQLVNSACFIKSGDLFLKHFRGLEQISFMRYVEQSLD